MFKSDDQQSWIRSNVARVKKASECYQGSPEVCGKNVFRHCMDAQWVKTFLEGWGEICTAQVHSSTSNWQCDWYLSLISSRDCPRNICSMWSQSPNGVAHRRPSERGHLYSNWRKVLTWGNVVPQNDIFFMFWNFPIDTETCRNDTGVLRLVSTSGNIATTKVDFCSVLSPLFCAISRSWNTFRLHLTWVLWHEWLRPLSEVERTTPRHSISWHGICLPSLWCISS